MIPVQPRLKSAQVLVFVDAGLEDYATLCQGITAEAIVLHSDRDGIEQISQALTQYASVETIQIFAHGAPGTLYLGNSQLSLTTLNRYSWDLQSWFRCSRSPKLALYGCDVAQGDAGTEFVEKLHCLTGATIFASRQQVGNFTRRDRWELEVSVGTAQSFAQVFEPQTLESYSGVLGSGSDGNYRWVDSKEAGGAGSAAFVDISSTGSVVSNSSNEDWMQKVTLPFSFNFYSSSFTEIGIASNGALLFNAAAINATTFTSNNTTAIPSNTAAYQFGIFPLWDDWKTNATAKVYSQVLGTGNNRRLVVQWNTVPHFVGNGDVTFQVILHEGSNNFDFIYSDTFISATGLGSDYNYGGDATVGINRDGTAGIEYSVDQPSLEGVTSIRFFTEPRLTQNSLTLEEGETITLTPNNLSAFDIDNSGNPARLRFDVSAVQYGKFQLDSSDTTSFTLADINAGKVRFIHDGSDNAPSYNVTVTDGVNSSAAQAATITYTPVSDPAVLTDLTAAITFQESAVRSPVILDGAVTLTDVDSPNFSGGQLVVSYSSGGGAEDQLWLTGNKISLSDRQIRIDGKPVGTIDAFKDGSNGKELVINFSGSDATLAAVKAVIESLSYRNLSVQPAASRTLTLTLKDGDGGISNPMTVTVQITPENDLPAIEIPVVPTLQEDTPFGFSSPITVADPDSNLVRVSLSATQGTLSMSRTTGLSFTSGTGSNEAAFSFAGSLTDLNAALASLTFKPNANYHGAASIQITADDLEDNDSSTADTKTINLTIAAVNDPPVNEVPAVQTVDEDADLVFSAASGNALSISDLDLEEGTGQVRVTLSVARGRLSLSQLTGLTFVEGSGTNDAIMTFVGSASEINAALNGLKYRGDANFNGSDQLTIITNDQGNFGGNPQLDRDSVRITVRPVDDRPVITGQSVSSIDEKVVYSFVPTVENLDGDPLTFSIVNQPAWASFDSQTGQLSGIPDTINAGTTRGITISVFDGVSSVSLPAFELTVLTATINGLPGGDTLTGNEKNNTIRGQQGNDTVAGQTGNDTVYGDEGDDQLDGGEGDDILYGGDGNDALSGGNGNDILYGDAGTNSLLGGFGDDLLTGGDGNDLLDGGDGNDRIVGRGGNDNLIGGTGNDVINGGTGKNRLQGNAGADVFILTPKSFARIRDFQDRSDRLAIPGLSGRRAFKQLDLTQKGGRTILEFQDQPIAELTGITLRQITAADFTRATVI
jgi:VCBS repeat-containing protein